MRTAAARFRVWWAARDVHDREAGERGASVVEYVFLTALIAVVCMVAVAFLGSTASESLDTSGSSMFVR